ncbi:glycosyltransferase [Micromonospora peucetia]|uniref:Glycosyltransferase involved in cell wall bisynthesis n=1 Tax=Micromonospora peucetia TaxID=47871 RepID=A0A1C6W622_9ACTN|nr:glycosyltransferase [Micromonospora peucetia]SCL73992.1 Glycosyltransferase involved in cell wall bisynthesis [Micromonospora peucetia]
MTGAGTWIAYVGPFRFPWGEPGSRRVFGLAQSMAAAGRDVVVVSGESGPKTPVTVSTAGAGLLRHVGAGERPSADASIVSKAVQMVVRLGERTVRWLDEQPTRPECVVVYGGGAQYMARVGRWCRRNGVALVADVVEWYAPHQMPGGALGPPHLSAKLALRHQYPRCQGIIAISSLLERHYRERGCRVLLVPPTLDVFEVKPGGHAVTTEAGPLNAVYFGTPGRKDLLTTIIRATDAVSRRTPVTLSVYGPTVEQVRDLLDGADLPSSVRVPGRVPQQDVEAIVRNADFSVLVRPSERFTHAGFPTKFVESLACGTPVIANLTSDMGRYLQDGRQGFVCVDHSSTELERVLRRAAMLPRSQHEEMRVAARATAESSFDYRRFAQPVAGFLDSLHGRRYAIDGTTGPAVARTRRSRGDDIT